MPERQTILLVDDEEDIVQLATKRLEAAGFAVTALLSGALVLETARREQPDVILLDVKLPDLSGLDLFRQLRADPDTVMIPIIFFSASAEDEPFCRETLQADGFIKKPYDPDELIRLIQRTLANRPGS